MAVLDIFNKRRRFQEKQIRNKIVKINNRDMRMEDLYRQIYDGLYELGLDYAYIIEHMFTQDGQYVICTTGGKLYRVNVLLDGEDKITLSEPITVEVQYIPVEEDEEERVNRPTVFRSKSGELMFMSISCASVLNRIGVIDSRDLFDSMEKEYEKRKNKAYLTFYHLGKAFQFGEIRGCFRYENFLITYGSIDETTTLGEEAERNLLEDGWGVSIGFASSTEPIMQRFGNVEIPIYIEGRLIEVSVLKEADAASYFTNVKSTRDDDMGVTREQAKKKLLEFAGKDKEDNIDELLNEADLRQRKIEDEELITRSSGEPDEENQEEAETEEEQETVEVTEDVVVELDEEAVRAISTEVIAGLSAENIGSIIRTILAEELKKFEERIGGLETAKNEAETNRPTSKTSTINVTYRPSKTGVERSIEVEEVDENQEPVITRNTVDFKNLRAKAKEQREKTLIVKAGK